MFCLIHPRYKLQSLPNPTHSLRAGGKTGKDKGLQDDWFSLVQVNSFFDKLVGEVQDLLSETCEASGVANNNEKDNESSSSISGLQEDGSGESAHKGPELLIQIGCAKGKHRSVAMVERLSKHDWKKVDNFYVVVHVIHRDLQKDSVKDNKRTKMDKRNRDRSNKFKGQDW